MQTFRRRDPPIHEHGRKVKFLHLGLFLPTVDTLCKAIDNGQLIGFPNITSKMVRKYFPELTATTKGHLNWKRKGLRSTNKGMIKQESVDKLDFTPNKAEITEV
jgi:hypothetical protein